MDPSIIDSSAFGQIWKVAFNQKEQVRLALQIRIEDLPHVSNPNFFLHYPAGYTKTGSLPTY